MAEIIYHYTSLRALYDIIKTKSLLLTSLNSMNDPSEGSYSPENFISDLDLIFQKKLQMIQKTL